MLVNTAMLTYNTSLPRQKSWLHQNSAGVFSIKKDPPLKDESFLTVILTY